MVGVEVGVSLGVLVRVMVGVFVGSWIKVSSKRGKLQARMTNPNMEEAITMRTFW
jgi:hypothetical protein